MDLGLIYLLLGLVMVVGVLRVLDGVLNQLLERVALADKFNEFGVAATTAEHDESVLLVEELLNRAALLLVQQLVDFNVSSIEKNHNIKYFEPSHGEVAFWWAENHGCSNATLPLVENKV